MKEKLEIAFMILVTLFLLFGLLAGLLSFVRFSVTSTTRKSAVRTSSKSPQRPKFVLMGASLGSLIGSSLAAALGGAPDYGMFGVALGLPVGAFLGLIFGLQKDSSSASTPESTAEPPPIPEPAGGKGNDLDEN